MKWILAILILASITYAWDCPTHQHICQLMNATGNCCTADSTHIPAASKHHCANNSETCAARLAAQQYASQSEIAAHLWADAMAPPHWFSFTPEDHNRCHSDFETKVGKAIGTPGWSVSVTGCHTRDGQVVDLYADEAFLQSISGHPQTPPSQLDMNTIIAAIIIALAVIALVAIWYSSMTS